MVIEPLSGDCRLLLFPRKELKLIAFGNTGFLLQFYLDKNPYRTFFDFLPEGRIIPDESSSAKHASILCVSLLSVYKFLNNRGKMDEFGMERNKIYETSAATNPRLINAIKGLFARHGRGSFVSAEPDANLVYLNLKEFGQLELSDPLIKYLERVSERAKGLMVIYEKYIKN